MCVYTVLCTRWSEFRVTINAREKIIILNHLSRFEKFHSIFFFPAARLFIWEYRCNMKFPSTPCTKSYARDSGSAFFPTHYACWSHWNGAVMNSISTVTFPNYYYYYVFFFHPVFLSSGCFLLRFFRLFIFFYFSPDFICSPWFRHSVAARYSKELTTSA